MANPNPSPETRFGAEGGNPNTLGGKTKEQRECEYRAAEMSARLREHALSVMTEKMEAGVLSLEEIVNAATLKLLKDSEDRAHGTPRQAVDHTSSDGTMSPVSKIENQIIYPDKK